MENRQEAFTILKDIFEVYFDYRYNAEINLTCEEYFNDGLKFHKWIITPVVINAHTYTKIEMSNGLLNDLLEEMNDYPIEHVVKNNEDILRICIKE